MPALAVLAIYLVVTHLGPCAITQTLENLVANHLQRHPVSDIITANYFISLLTSFQGACNQGDFCLVDQYCCPGGIDPAQCALSYGVTLPADYVASTPTPTGSASEIVTPSTAPGSVFTGSPTQSVPSPSVAVFTGAASAKNVVGYTGMFSSILALILDLF